MATGLFFSYIKLGRTDGISNYPLQWRYRCTVALVPTVRGLQSVRSTLLHRLYYTNFTAHTLLQPATD